MTWRYRLLGETGLEVSDVCLGTSALGSFPEQYGYEVDYRAGVDTVLAALRAGLNFIDTSNNYGDAERRIGAALREFEGSEREIVVATKIDPKKDVQDFSYGRAFTSLGESTERLGIDRIPLLYLHDPEQLRFEDAFDRYGPATALVEMKKRGLVGSIGVAGGDISLLTRYLDSGAFDVMICHNKCTLLDRSAEAFARACAAAKVGFVNAAPYGGGMLSRGPRDVGTYAYSAVGTRLHRLAYACEDLCREAGVPLAAAALQFSTRHPDVGATIVGMSAPERILATRGLYEVSIPPALWSSLEDAYAEFASETGRD